MSSRRRRCRAQRRPRSLPCDRGFAKLAAIASTAAPAAATAAAIGRVSPIRRVADRAPLPRRYTARARRHRRLALALGTGARNRQLGLLTPSPVLAAASRLRSPSLGPRRLPLDVRRARRVGASDLGADRFSPRPRGSSAGSTASSRTPALRAGAYLAGRRARPAAARSGCPRIVSSAKMAIATPKLLSRSRNGGASD